MAEYFDLDEAVKEYDSKIAGRIFSYLKPYKAIVFLAILAIILSTAGELALPVLIQRAIDNAIMPSYLRVSEGVFLRQAQSSEDSIDTEPWYAFSYTEGTEAERVVQKYASLFEIGSPSDASQIKAGIRKGDLSKLLTEEVRLIRTKDLRTILHTALLFLLILSLVLAATFVQTFTTTLIGQKVMKDIRLNLFKRSCSQSLAFLSRHPVGRIVTRLTGDVETINEFFTSVLIAFLKDFSVMIGVLITLFILSPKLALVTLLTLPPVAVATAISRVKARDAFRKQRIASSKVNAYLSERLAGVQVVQLFTREKTSAKEFAARDKELLDANLGEMYVFAAFRPIIDFLAATTTAIVIAVGASMFLDLSISLGVLIAFINLVAMFYSPVQDIAEKYTLLQSAMAGGERVFAFMDVEEGIPDTGNHSFASPIQGRVDFDSVAFSYKEGENILRNLSFTVQSGEMLAIVGYTGAGKTTVINLLTRLWDVDAGEIRLDGIPIKNIPLSDLRRAVLPVLQDVFLFSGTVSDNIKLGLGLSDLEVENAAKAVHAHEFISRLPEGYATILSEGATNVSSGQRQLISFARVVAHDPSLVILDEATSSIDSETEQLIQLGLQTILSGRSSLVIAHRLSTIRHANRILVLSAGTLVEDGSHEELMAAKGIYAGLYKLQYERGAQ
ncbi:ABC transporter ATP-binding protein [Treponema sp.]